MHVLGMLVLGLQGLCILHALKTGRDDRWIWLIYVPGVGLVAYLLMELLPDARRSGAVRDVGLHIASFVDPGRTIREHEAALEESDTVNNRMQLARACLADGQHARALELYEACLAGPHASSPEIRVEYALALHLAGEHARSLEIVDALRADAPGTKKDEVGLLRAQVLEAMEAFDDALTEYEVLEKHFPGEEARCRHGLLLERLGRAEQARAVFEAIDRNARRSPAHFRRRQRQWIAEARRRLG